MEQLKICYEHWQSCLYSFDSGPRPRVTGVSLKVWFNVFVGESRQGKSAIERSFYWVY